METETKPSQTAGSQRLPDDILFDILSRLPVQYLLQYRCVCKSWHSMISDPQFVKTHLHQSTQSLDSQKLLIRPPSNKYISINCEFCGESKMFDSPWKTGLYGGEVLCTFDGLVLLCYQYRPFGSPNIFSKTFVLWNPSIKKHVMFPCSYNSKNGSSSEIYGLCFDSSTNGYKVIILSQTLGIFVWVFDSKTLSWKEIGESSFSISSRENGVVVNGALHWIVRSGYSLVIVYFDLVEEKFKEIPKPDYGSKNDEFGLVSLRGWLCVHIWADQAHFEV